MAVAEEERRKRALEDRRKAQQDATEKFKMAISRLRSVSKPQQSQNPSRNDVHVECKSGFQTLVPVVDTVHVIYKNNFGANCTCNSDVI